jgi:hypothetical protein
MPANEENGDRAQSGGKTVDPAELIFFRELTPERFFDEAQRQGVSAEKLRDIEVHNQVFSRCLVNIRAEIAKAVASALSIPISDEQAVAIGRNSLVPDVLPEPAPLDAAECALAEELYFHAIKAAVARYGNAMTDKVARANAKKMVRAGQRGFTRMQKLRGAVGCLVVLAVAGLGAALTLLSVALALAAS